MGELSVVSGVSVKDISDVAKAAKQVLEKGSKIVLVRDLGSAGLSPWSHGEMLIMREGEAWHASWPLPDDEYSVAGIGDGDLTSALLIGNLLAGSEMKVALQETAVSRYEIMQAAAGD